ncbi:Clp protease/crotonase-like domain-containing protein [Bergeyella zoohelcum]|uniref:Peptidase S49 domain-containing protein n=1 Tax=Bergeyella zoohelcum ATCC 43767 TaxID=883096 RepID=K1MKT2_9FLAO|nr:hypothetical protein [Bergeyella zoohelcum]EKB56584.1 hypothetical protein HMPREF9699_01313 [Bergeyella zoohelcum ATCC 43767]SUV48508.1 Protease 4 [Bergeyella zoohelcum]
MNLISEIIRGTWLLEGANLQHYEKVAKAILENASVKKIEPQSYSYISKQEITSKGEVIEVDKVAVVSMIGEMTKYGGACSFGANYYTNEILKANANPEIKGIILSIDGPGGNADAITLFQSIKSKIKKPVIALVDRACSLHYWIASMLSDHIMLGNDFTSECGSIGAMIVFQKPKDEIIIIRPPESQDKNEDVINALAGNYEGLEKRLSIISQRFMNDVKTYRPQVKDEALHGKTYLAKEAIKVGLADSIGDMDKAYNLVLTLFELKQLK